MNTTVPDQTRRVGRRDVIAGAFAGFGVSSLARTAAAVEDEIGNDAPIARRDGIKITKLETFLVQPRWLFLKVHTNA